MVQVRASESYTYTDSAYKAKCTSAFEQSHDLFENLFTGFPTRFDTNQAIQKHNLCGFSVILCLYNSHVSKQVLPPLVSRKNGQISQMMLHALLGTTKSTHNTKHKIKIKPSLHMH